MRIKQQTLVVGVKRERKLCNVSSNIKLLPLLTYSQTTKKLTALSAPLLVSVNSTQCSHSAVLLLLNLSTAALQFLLHPT